jgi:hypothetical protein
MTKKKRATSTGKPAVSTSEHLPISGALSAAASLEIFNIRFTQLSALTSLGPLEPVPSAIQARIGFTRPSVLRGDNRIFISMTFLVRVKDKSQPDRPPVVDFRAGTELTYVVRPGATVTAADLDEFARVNAPFNAWSYWRELYQSTLLRFHLPPVPLPLFRVQDAARLMLEPEAKGE